MVGRCIKGEVGEGRDAKGEKGCEVVDSRET